MSKEFTEEAAGNANFIHDIIDDDLKNNRVSGQVHTRFPPEPNGYLHIGSAKAIWINYTAAKKYGGLFNLRYDDTNPTKEDTEYVESILEDITWLIGEKPSGGIFYGSDYFDVCYDFAVWLIKQGRAYVCNLSAEEMREYRGAPTEAGRESPYKNRTAEENLALFESMKNGEFPDGHCTLRVKIDMSSSNTNLRDPAIYRIVHMSHHRQGDKWCVYPLYDYAHPVQDAVEGITHSLCSLEFENHRPLYDWVADAFAEYRGDSSRPKQYEFARLNVTNVVMSKRYLRSLVETGLVDGWDDPRMPTLSGLRRRGYTPASVMDFVRRAGVAKVYSTVEYAALEHCIREELNESAPRRVAVTDPIKVVITNYGKSGEIFKLPNHPAKPEYGTRDVLFGRTLYIERDDFAEVPPPKFFRLKPGGEVRLMGAYIIKCEEVIKDERGEIVEIRCTADLETGNGNPADKRKIKGTIHWLNADTAEDGEITFYDRLFTYENMNEIDEREYDKYLNRDSVKLYPRAKFEHGLTESPFDARFQFVRVGYFTRDSKFADNSKWLSIVPLKSSK